MKQTEQRVASVVKKAEEGAARNSSIDWDQWESKIAHKDIVKRYALGHLSHHCTPVCVSVFHPSLSLKGGPEFGVCVADFTACVPTTSSNTGC